MFIKVTNSQTIGEYLEAMGIIKYMKSLIKAMEIVQNEWRKSDFHFGDVVQTKGGYDRGLVTKVDENNMPIEILASPGFCANTGDYTETSYYGGVTSVKWYKTGEHMTPQQWMQTYSTKGGWQRYCHDRENQSKLE